MYCVMQIQSVLFRRNQECEGKGELNEGFSVCIKMQWEAFKNTHVVVLFP